MEDDILRKGLEHGFLDRNIIASEKYIPQLIMNDPSKGEKVITTLKQQMESCDEFMFPVAFINSGGVNALAQEFRELDRRDVRDGIIAPNSQFHRTACSEGSQKE